MSLLTLYHRSPRMPTICSIFAASSGLRHPGTHSPFASVPRCKIPPCHRSPPPLPPPPTSSPAFAKPPPKTTHLESLTRLVRSPINRDDLGWFFLAMRGYLVTVEPALRFPQAWVPFEPSLVSRLDDDLEQLGLTPQSTLPEPRVPETLEEAWGVAYVRTNLAGSTSADDSAHESPIRRRPSPQLVARSTTSPNRCETSIRHQVHPQGRPGGRAGGAGQFVVADRRPGQRRGDRDRPSGLHLRPLFTRAGGRAAARVGWGWGCRSSAA